MKENGRELKWKLEKARNDISNSKEKINRRYDYIISNMTKYISPENVQYIHSNPPSLICLDKKIEIIIDAEDNYAKESSNQLNMF